MYCKICGAALNPGDVFCRNCGASNTNLNNNQPNQGMQPNVPNVQPSMNNQPEASQQSVNLNDQFNANNQLNNQYQSMEFVEPFSSMNNYQQPTPPTGLAYQQPTPSVQPMPNVQTMPNVQPNIPTPPVNNNYPQPMNQNKNENKSNGTVLMIIGIIVGVLAIAVVGYLIYTTLATKKADNGTTIVSKKNYNVYFAKHKFTFENDDVAATSTDDLGVTVLEVTTNNYIAKILYSDDFSPEILNTSIVTQIIQKFVSNGSIQTGDNVKSSTYAGLTYWKFNFIVTGEIKGTSLIVPKSNGGTWMVSLYNLTNMTTYPTDSTINSVLELIKSATISTTSSIQTDFDFSSWDFSSITNPETQESAE